MSDESNPFIARTKCDRTPVSKVPPQQDNQETPLNASSTNIGAGSDTTPRSLYDSIGAVTRRRLSLTPSGNNEDIVGATAKSPLDVDTEDLLDMPGIGQTDLGRNLEDSLESDIGIRQFKENVVRAQGIPFNKMMEQNEGFLRMKWNIEKRNQRWRGLTN